MPFWSILTKFMQYPLTTWKILLFYVLSWLFAMQLIMTRPDQTGGGVGRRTKAKMSFAEVERPQIRLLTQLLIFLSHSLSYRMFRLNPAIFLTTHSNWTMFVARLDPVIRQPGMKIIPTSNMCYCACEVPRVRHR
jgi:hypothetical protein